MTISRAGAFGYLPLVMFSSSLALLLFVFLMVAVVIRFRQRRPAPRGRNGLHLTLEKRPVEQVAVDDETSSQLKGERTPDVIPTGEYY